MGVFTLVGIVTTLYWTVRLVLGIGATHENMEHDKVE